MTEFIALFSLTTALTAMSIDTILPALRQMGLSLAVADPNDVQLVISMFILGMVLGELVFGVLSDAYGRKLTIQIGLAIFAFGCFVSMLADSLEMVLVGRIIQGIGAAGPKIGSRALIRDRFEGAEMARVMSFIMMVFALTPMIAPFLGQVIVVYGGWHAVFGAFLVAALVISTWMGLRQPETLPPGARIAINPAQILRNTALILGRMRVFALSVAVGLIFGCILTYVSLAPAMLYDIYGIDRMFPAYFAALAVSLAVSSFVNAQLVRRHGMGRLVRIALGAMAALGGILTVMAMALGGSVPLWLFMAACFGIFFCMGVVFGNMNAMAMVPLGRVAGLGASLNASLSSLVAIVVAIPVGQAYDQSLLPFAGLITAAGATALVLTNLAERSSAKPV